MSSRTNFKSRVLNNSVAFSILLTLNYSYFKTFLVNEVKINNDYFRFYKWPTKTKRDNKKINSQYYFSLSCHSNILNISTSLPMPSRCPTFLVTGTVVNLLRVLSPGPYTHLPAAGDVGSQCPHLLFGQGMCEPPQPEVPKRSCSLCSSILQSPRFGVKQSLWCNSCFRAHCGIRLRPHVS